MSTHTTPLDGTFEAHGLQFHYLDWGNAEAPPMLLLHGFTGHAHTWDTFASALCDRYHIVAFDQRGHGDSAWAPDGAYTVHDHAKDVRALIEHVDLEPVILIGLSMGGRNAIAFTATYPEHVAKLVIVDIGPDIAPQGAERVAKMAGQAPEEFDSPEQAVDYLAQFLPYPATDALRQRVQHGTKRLPSGKYTWKYDPFLRQQRRTGNIPRVDLWPLVERLNVPTLIVRGGKSDVFGLDTARRMQRLIPDCALIEIPDAGHSVPAESPSAFENAVRHFLGA